MQLNLTDAAKSVNKNRSTIWRHIKSGKLSAMNSSDGKPQIDTSELIRVYGELQHVQHSEKEKLQHRATSFATPNTTDKNSDVDRLITTVEQQQKQIEKLTSTLENLINRLEYQPINKAEPEPMMIPENEPDWPEKIISIADVVKRKEIKERLLSPILKSA